MRYKISARFFEMIHLSNPPGPRSPRREDNRFDVLRLLAAWLVLFSHCYPLGGRPGQEPLASSWGIDTLGGVGVAIFFVLSGYLVTLSLERSAGVLEFARRRALRIFPGLVVVVLLCTLLLGPLLTTLPQADYWLHSMTRDYLKTASAWHISYVLPGVFADNPLANAVNGSLWSLPYELTCYVVLALGSMLPLTLRTKVTLATVLLTALVLLRPVVPPASPFDTFYGLDHYHTKLGLIFALGAVFASWREHIRPLVLPGVLALLAAFMLPLGGVRELFYLLGLGSVTLWLALYGRCLPSIPKRIGDWSYGAYLYGFPVQQVLAHYKLHEMSFLGFVLTSTVVTATLAGLSWHLVEKQALRWK